MLVKEIDDKKSCGVDVCTVDFYNDGYPHGFYAKNVIGIPEGDMNNIMG